MSDPTSATHWLAAFKETGPHTVHGVGHSDEVVQAVEAAAWNLGMPLGRIDGSTVTDTDDLLARIGKELAFPYECSGWNALIDMLSSVDDYIPGKPGYVLLVEHADALRKAARRTFDTLVDILPSVSDRWRTVEGPRFHVVFTGERRMREAAGRIVGRASRRKLEGLAGPYARPADTFHPSVLLDHGEGPAPGT